MWVSLYRDGPNRGVRVILGPCEVWLYMGRSFELGSRIQRQRISHDCGFVQFAYGQVRHFGVAARRTVGLQIAGTWLTKS